MASFSSIPEEVYKRPFTFNFQWPALEEAPQSRADSLRKNHVMFSSSVSTVPGTYQVVIESRDHTLGSIGLFKSQNAYGYPDSALAMSDLLLATSIEEKTAFPESRAPGA